jgi:hypothetical protein
MGIQAEPGTFFAHLRQQAQFFREVPQQAFAQARAKLSATAIPGVNDWLIARAETHRFVPRWLVLLVDSHSINHLWHFCHFLCKNLLRW